MAGWTGAGWRWPLAWYPQIIMTKIITGGWLGWLDRLAAWYPQRIVTKIIAGPAGAGWADLIVRVKQVQRQGGGPAWHRYCARYGRRTFDPRQHDDDFMRTFLDNALAPAQDLTHAHDLTWRDAQCPLCALASVVPKAPPCRPG